MSGQEQTGERNLGNVSTGRRVGMAVSLALVLLIGLFQLKINPPADDYVYAPEGWNTSLETDDLSGLIATFSVVSTPLFLNPTDYARIIAYASDAYWRTRYTNREPEQARAAFLEVVTSLIPDRTFAARLPKVEGPTGSAAQVLAEAGSDGYSAGQPDPKVYRSPLDLGVDPERYSWKVAYGIGNEIERGWGSLRTMRQTTCKAPAPDLRSYVELEAAANEVAAVTRSLMSNPDARAIRPLTDAWTYAWTSQPARAWLDIATHVKVDADLTTEESDRMLRNLALAIHDTMIVAWAGKYHYALAGPIDVASDPFVLTLFNPRPPYPSEYAAVGAAATAIMDRYAPDTRPRLEIRGSLVSVPSTRVFNSYDDAMTESTSAALVQGLDYRFAQKAGSELGRCVAEGYLND